MNKRDKKRDKELAEQCYVNPSEFDYKKFADLIRADEREEIAQFIEQTNLGSLPEQTALHYAQLLRSYSTAIRARGNT
jgi:hypothetical protein